MRSSASTSAPPARDRARWPWSCASEWTLAGPATPCRATSGERALLVSAPTAYQAFAVLRLVLTLLLGGLFVWLALGRPVTRGVRVATFALLVAAAIAYPNFGVFHPDRGHIHYWDVYHYFMGAKYLPEVGYAHLYEATYVAGREMGALGDATIVRDPTTYEFRDVRSIDPAAVRARFTAERWRDFKRDLAFIGNHIREWPGPLLDRGYNDSPPRALLMHLLVRHVRPTSLSLTLLTAIDYALMLLALVAVWRAFGALPTALAFSFFWLSFFARFDYIGGSLLRWDWIAAILIAVAALAHERPVTAGVCLGYAALARIFPLVFLVPLAVKWLQALRRGERAPLVARTLAAAVAMLVVVVAGLLAAGESRTSMLEYVTKIQRHSREAATNSIGLSALIVFHRAPWRLNTDGSILVTEGEALAAQPPAWVAHAAAGAFFVLVLPLILAASPLTSLMYAVPLVFWGLSATGYYYSFLVLLVLLPWRDGWPDRVRLLQMALLTIIMAVDYAREAVSPDLVPLYYGASLGLAVFFVLWLAFEYARMLRVSDDVDPAPLPDSQRATVLTPGGLARRSPD